MKKICSIFTAVVLFLSGFSQNLNLEWVNSMGGQTGDVGYSITTEDQTGNVYITGAYSGTTDFDPGSSLFNMTANGGGDIYIQKLDANENLIWAKSVGGSAWDNGQSIALDSAGNVYITGYFLGVVDFDPGVGTYYLTSNGLRDIFILKLDPSGSFIWAKSLGGISNDNGLCITIDISGNVYLTGNYQDSVDFDPGLSTYNLISKGYDDIYVLKIDGNGNFIWAISMGGPGFGVGWSIKTVGADAVYVSGSFEDTLIFYPSSAAYNVIAKGYHDALVFKLDGLGNLKWVIPIGAVSASAESRSVTADLAGNIYVSGSFDGAIDFNPSSSVFILTSSGSYDIFIQKLDPNGNFIWAKSMGGMFDDESFYITSDDSANVYMTGVYTGTADFDPDTSSHFLMSAGTWDTYVLKLDSSGKFKNAGSVGGIGYDFGFSISTEPNGYAQYVTGNFAGTADFDPSSSTHNLTSNGGTDIFNLKLSACGQVKGIHKIEACDSYTWVNGITYTANNNSATYTSTNANGCDSVSTLNLTINTVDASVAVSDSIITANDTGAIYQWLDCNNNYAPLLGDSGQSFTAKLNGKYAVAVTKNGCSDTSDCIAITSIGIENLSLDNTVSIYPVPASGKLNIEYSGSDEISSILIFNLMGEKMLEMHDRELGLDVSNLASGIYSILILFSEGNQYQAEFVKD